jgi:hypothetical protein
LEDLVALRPCREVAGLAKKKRTVILFCTF